METEVKVHEIGILFDYEIWHEDGVNWGASENEKDSDGWIDKGKDFFGGLFGGGDDEDEGDEGNNEEASSDGESALLELEQNMAAEVWDNMQDDDKMTWVEDDVGDWECTGLIVEDDTRHTTMRSLEGDGETKLLGLSYLPQDYVNPNGEFFCSYVTDGTLAEPF